MPLEITGKLLCVLPEQTGTGKAGPWTKQEFVIETQDQSPRKVCFSSWNEKTGILKNLHEGDLLKVSFNAESRDYNGRWYTDLRAWRIETQSKAQESSSVQREQASNDAAIGNTDISVSEDADDLPF